jgi:hypothetical protein
MKQFSTFILSSKRIIFLVFFSLPIMVQAQFLLNQNFNSSTVVANYVGTGTDQFDYIGVSAPSASNTVYASGNRLTLQRYSGAAALVKSTNLSSTPPAFLRIKFKLNVPFNSIPTTIPQTQAVIYVGSGLFPGTATTGELANLASRHSSIGVGFGTSGKFYLRSSNFLNSPDSLIGEQEINWFINNSGAATDYVNPTGATSNLADDQSDVWVGNTRVFAAIPAITPTVELNNLKVLFNQVGGALAFDDFEITTGTNALPVSIKSFNASIVGQANLLSWITASELNNKGFDVQRQSKNGSEWESLGFVNGSNRAATYTFKDNSPLVNSFYRLRQVDMDGKVTYSKVISVNKRMKDKVIISPNPANDKVTINLNQIDLSNSTATVSLYDLTGRKVLSKNAITGTFELDLSNLSKGIYTLTIQSDSFMYNERIIRQ